MTEKLKRGEKSGGVPSPFSAFHIEVNRSVRGIAVLASGIIGISDFSEERAVLMSHGGRIIILGKRLSICIYENKTVEISGKVEDIKFTYGKA